ncbi:MAG: hypothetical protein ACRCXT_18130 [Paraclostridium sp.]
MKLGKDIIKFYSERLNTLFLCDVKNKKEVYLCDEDAKQLLHVIEGKEVLNFDVSELVKEGFLDD